MTMNIVYRLKTLYGSNTLSTRIVDDDSSGHGINMNNVFQFYA